MKIIRSVERTNTTYITIVSTTGLPTSVTVWKELCKLSGSRSSLFFTRKYTNNGNDAMRFGWGRERESEHGAHRQATITFCGVWSVAHFFPPFTYILGRTQINRIITTTTKNKLNECWVFEENSFVIRSCARSSFHCFFWQKKKFVDTFFCCLASLKDKLGNFYFPENLFLLHFSIINSNSIYTYSLHFIPFGFFSQKVYFVFVGYLKKIIVLINSGYIIRFVSFLHSSLI